MNHPCLDARNNKKLLRAEYHKMEASFLDSKEVHPRQFQKHLSNLLSFSPKWNFPYRKMGSGPIRPRFIQTTFSYLVEDLKNKQIDFPELSQLEHLCTHQIAYIWEISICIQYLHNQILDGKAGVRVTSAKKIKDNLVQAQTLKNALYGYMQSEISDVTQLNLIKNALSKVFLYVDVGQYIEQIRCAEFLNEKPKERIELSAIFRRLEDDICLYYSNKKNTCIQKPFNEWSQKDIKSIRKELILDNLCEQIKIDDEPNLLNIRRAVRNLIKEIKQFIDQDLIKKTVSNFIPEGYSASSVAEITSQSFIHFQKTYLTCAASYIIGFKLIWQLLINDIPLNKKISLLQEKYYPNLLLAIKYFGLMRQLVNDITDVLPVYLNTGTAAKWPRDAFSDLRNRNITLLIALHLFKDKKPGDPVRSYLESNKQKIKYLHHHKLLISLINSGALDTAQKFAKILSKTGLSYLDKKNNSYQVFSYFFSIAYYNKFYARLLIYQKFTANRSDKLREAATKKSKPANLKEELLKFYFHSTGKNRWKKLGDNLIQVTAGSIGFHLNYKIEKIRFHGGSGI